MKVLFTESQNFRQLWIWLLLILSALLGAVGIEVAYNSVPAEKLGNFFWVQVLVVVVAFSLPILLLYVCRLTTSITEHEVTLNFFPFHAFGGPKRIPLADISKAYAREYSPIGEFGGWGIRWVGRGKRAYNVSGNRGVTLELKDNSTILIGSQRSDELEACLKQLLEQPPKHT